MPNFITQKDVLIDSLSERTIKLQNHVKVLEIHLDDMKDENKLVLDSMRLLAKTIQQADIKTGFFTDELSFYTCIFGFGVAVAIGVASYLNFSKFYEPIRKTVDDIKERIIPKEIKKIDEDILKVANTSLRLSQSMEEYLLLILNSAVTMAETKNSPREIFLANLQLGHYALITLKKQPRGENLKEGEMGEYEFAIQKALNCISMPNHKFKFSDEDFKMIDEITNNLINSKIDFIRNLAIKIASLVEEIKESL